MTIRYQFGRGWESYIQYLCSSNPGTLVEDLFYHHSPEMRVEIRKVLDVELYSLGLIEISWSSPGKGYYPRHKLLVEPYKRKTAVYDLFK